MFFFLVFVFILSPSGNFIFFASMFHFKRENSFREKGRKGEKRGRKPDVRVRKRGKREGEKGER